MTFFSKRDYREVLELCYLGRIERRKRVLVLCNQKRSVRSSAEEITQST